MLTAIIQWIMIVIFSLAAAMKLLRTASMVRHWTEYRYPMPLMTIVGLMEIAAVAGLAAGFWHPALLKYVSAVTAVLMAGAVHAHLFRAGHRPVMASNALLMLLLSVILLFR